jgi:hypothetical protein
MSSLLFAQGKRAAARAAAVALRRLPRRGFVPSTARRGA